MARQKTASTSTETMVENTKSNVKETVVKEDIPKVYSTKELPMYKIPIIQHDLLVGYMVPGHIYEYLGKDVNTRGTFIYIKDGMKEGYVRYSEDDIVFE